MPKCIFCILPYPYIQDSCIATDHLQMSTDFHNYSRSLLSYGPILDDVRILGLGSPRYPLFSLCSGPFYYFFLNLSIHRVMNVVLKTFLTWDM